MICELRRPLTEKQHEVYDYICSRVASGLPPTIREIGAEFGIRSPNGVMCHVKALEKKGWIVRERDECPSRGRLIRLGPEAPEFLRANYLEDVLRELIRAINQAADRVRSRPEFRDAKLALKREARTS